MGPGARKGMTLIELIAVIVILGLSIPFLLTMWATISWHSSRSESMVDATFYAEQLMEEIKSKRFDENADTPWTSTVSFGVDSAESAGNRDTFDDIDDYAGCTDARVTVPATGYTRSVDIEYVRLETNTWQSCGAVACVAAANCATCSECCFKRIIVTVARNDNLVKGIKLVAIMSGFY